MTPSSDGDAGHAGQAGQAAHRRTVLPSGLRVVSQAMPSARSAAAMLLVGVGSRHESEREAGASHLIEHLVFKGTARYPEPGAISEAVESVGGEVNASTDREATLFAAKVPARHLDRALEVLAEMAFRPLLRASDLQAERPIVVDEIRMYQDAPADRVFTLFDALLFGRHPLGREIAGTPAGVRLIAHRTVAEHWLRRYRPERMVLAAAGAVDHDRLVARAAGWQPITPPEAVGAAESSERSAAATTDGKSGGRPAQREQARAPEPAPEPAPPGRVSVQYRQLGQGNLCLGMPGLARDDADRWALEMLCTILGDGMSSRLFIELRERRSLAYEISTFSSMFSDSGTVGVYAGFDPPRMAEVVRAILEQLERIVQEPVAAAELDKARAFTTGRIELRMEESGAVASWLGHGELLMDQILTVEDVVERLEAVTVEDVLRVARRLIRPEYARLAALGPFRGAARVGRLLSPAA